MPDHSPLQKQFQEAFSTANDLTEARRLCEQFLKMTATEASAMQLPQSPEAFLSRLLSGQEHTDTAPEKAFGQLTGRLFESYALLILSSDTGSRDFSAPLQQIRVMLNTWCFLHKNRLVCFTAAASGTAQTPEFDVLLKKYNLSGGLSRPFSDLSLIKTAYDQAAATLKTLRILGRSKTIACYDDFLMLRLLDGLREDVDIREFSMPDIQALLEYDKLHDSELCRTLLCYLEHAKNVSNTARELNVHRNTVHYRINKCTEILKNLDFSNDYITFLLMLSLHIAEYEYYRQMREKSAL